MLSKLLKYENRFYAKYLLLSYLVTFLTLILTRLSFESIKLLESSQNHSDVLDVLVTMPAIALFGASFILCAAVVFLPTVLSAIRFYRNLTKDQGYLSMTLPVKPSQHVFCKTFTPFFWSVLSLIVVIGSAAGIFLPFSDINLSDLVENFKDLFELFGLGDGYFITMVVESGLSILLSFLFRIVLINFSIACGQLFRKHKLLGSIGCFFLANIVSNIISSILSVVVLVATEVSGQEENYFIMISSLSFWIGLTFSVGIAVIEYLVTNHIMTKRLNLE